MQTAANAHIASIDAFTGLTYYDTLISGATVEGLFSINVDGNKVTDEQKATFIAAGYTVGVKWENDDKNWPRYIIGW